MSSKWLAKATARKEEKKKTAFSQGGWELSNNVYVISYL
jgi:hypothetical protein